MTADLNRGGFCVDATERCERQLTAIIKTHNLLQMGRKAEGIEKGAIVPSAVIAALSYAVQDGRRKRRGSRCPPRRRKSTRLNSSHVRISYAVFCLKKKK